MMQRVVGGEPGIGGCCMAGDGDRCGGCAVVLNPEKSVSCRFY